MSDFIHIKRFGFEYCRCGAISTIRIFDIIIFAKIGNNWVIAPFISKEDREFFKCH